jgi:hypothetical protein
VVPIDPRTGQPYPPTSRESAQASGYSAAPAAPLIVAQPPAPTLINVRLYPLNAQANMAGCCRPRWSTTTRPRQLHGALPRRHPAGRIDPGRCRLSVVRHRPPAGARRQPAYGHRTRGVANAHGAHGVNAQCEYVLTGPGSGTGVCQFSDGAYYQMHFGG